jgi:purine-binding chemotaxis protein CheW
MFYWNCAFSSVFSMHPPLVHLLPSCIFANGALVGKINVFMSDLIKLLEEVSQLEQRVGELKSTLRSRFIKEDVPPGEMTLLMMDAAEERLAVPVEYVQEVLPVCRLRSCPEAPPWVPGFLNLRGSMLPVLDVSARAKRVSRELTPTDFVVICQREWLRFGLLVQKVDDIFRPLGKQLEQPPPETPLAPYVLGFFQREQHSIYLLSLSCLVETSMLPVDVE